MSSGKVMSEPDESLTKKLEFYKEKDYQQKEIIYNLR